MSTTVRVEWLNRLQFVGFDAHKHSVVMSSQDHENGTGISPGQLMLIALGGCTAYDVVNILSKKRQRLTGLEVIVTGESASEPPWALQRAHLTYRLRGRGLSKKAVADAIALSKTRYCSVGATIGAGAEITTEFVIEEEEE